MVAETDTFANPVIWMTLKEEREDFERQVRSRLGMSAAEFLRDLDAGRWDGVIDDPDYRDVLILAVLSDAVR